MKPVGKKRHPITIDAARAKPKAFLVDWTKSVEVELAVKKRKSKIPGRKITLLEYLNRLVSLFIK